MANKQALREFQSRLAQRLQSARTSGVAASWLAVDAGALKLLFPLSHAGEIFSWSSVQPIPYAKPWLMGVANLRGGLASVVDLSAFIAGGQARRLTDSALSQARLVALNPVLETNCALLVDRLLGLRTAEAFTASAPPEADAPEYFGHMYTGTDGSRWQEVNLQLLSKHTPFLNVGA